MAEIDFTMRRLRLFEAVAEYEHFGRAAQAMFISTTALSEQIRKLETDIGVKLFDRTPRGAQLTVEGIELLEAARRILQEADKFELAVRSLRSEKGPAHLRLGFVPLGAGPLMPEFLTQFGRAFEDGVLDLIGLNFDAQLAAVTSADVDAAIVRGPLDLTGLRSLLLFREPRAAMMSRHNPLAAATDLTVAELAKVPRVTRENVPPEWRRWWTLDPGPEGETPPYGPAVLTFEEQVELAAIDRAISIVPESAAYSYARPDLAFVPIRDAEPSEVFLCARANNVRRPTALLFDIAMRVFQAEDSTPKP